MPTVQIEHAVRDFEGWKSAFDRDPARREASGVLRYRIARPVDDPRYVAVELDFDTREAAEAFVATMRGIWHRVEGTVMTDPRVRIVEWIETRTYRSERSAPAR